MNGQGSCDRFEREGALKVERGERLGLHYSLCSECKAAYARYQRIIAALSFMDEQEERDAFAEDRLLARLHEKSNGNRRWPKLVPLSAFFGFLSLSRRAAAAQSGKALCAATAIALVGPLPILVGAGEPPEGDKVMVANGITRPSIGIPGLEFATRAPPVMIRKHSRESASRETQALDRQKKAEPLRSRNGTKAAPEKRANAAPENLSKGHCARTKCPNIVLEMVVNGLTGYGNRPRGRRPNAQM